MKETTLYGPVAQQIFGIITYQWIPANELAREVIARLGPDRHHNFSLEHVRAVLMSLCRGGYIESLIQEGLMSGGGRRLLLHYRLIHRPKPRGTHDASNGPAEGLGPPEPRQPA